VIVAASIALSLAVCPVLYEQAGWLTVSVTAEPPHLAEEARATLTDLVAPFAGDPMAEISVASFFPHPVVHEDDPVYLAALERNEVVVDLIRSAGVDGSLIGRSHHALGLEFDENYQERTVDYPPERIMTVDVSVKRKTECHPLADLARQHDPYRR